MSVLSLSVLRKKVSPKLMLALGTTALVAVVACTGESKAKEKPHYTLKETQQGPLATIDGKPVSEEELMGEGEERMEYGEALKKVYDVRMARIGKVLLDRVYGEDAKKANMDIEQYVETKVLKGDDKISDKDFNSFVKEKGIPKEQIAQLKDRIYAYMKMQKKQDQLQAQIVKLSKEHKVDLFFKKPDIKVNIEIGSSPSFGKKDSKIKIVEFSDFQCPFCSRAAKTVTDLKKMYGNKIEFAFKQYPLPMHPNARPASEASLCVNAQSTDKFWKYHDKLFANSDKLDGESLKKFAKEVGANEAEFQKCMDEKRFAKAVEEDMAYGNKIGVRSTPTFFVNGKAVQGAQPIEAFKEIIEEELSGG